MLNNIFDFMFSSGAVQYLGAFLWGAASVLLSPCGIGIIPLVISYIENTENPTRSRAFKISCAFCLGIIFNLMLVAFVTSGIGMLLGGYEKLLTLFVAIVFIVMGLHLTGIIHVKIFALTSGAKGTESQNLKGAVILGIVSGLAVGPCSIAYVSPVLSLAISGASESGFMYSVSLILSYAIGYSLVIILAGTFAQVFAIYLQSERGDKVLKCVNILCGLGLIAAGLYFIYDMFYLL
ncbi:MAG: cytochrome C biogenesis protein [Synergistaceae bacterium]|nr:cytochrome C biogenesis protein [Synergistaceae bacterium]